MQISNMVLFYIRPIMYHPQQNRIILCRILSIIQIQMWHFVDLSNNWLRILSHFVCNILDFWYFQPVLSSRTWWIADGIISHYLLLIYIFNLKGRNGSTIRTKIKNTRPVTCYIQVNPSCNGAFVNSGDNTARKSNIVACSIKIYCIADLTAEKKPWWNLLPTRAWSTWCWMNKTHRW